MNEEIRTHGNDFMVVARQLGKTNMVRDYLDYISKQKSPEELAHEYMLEQAARQLGKEIQEEIDQLIIDELLEEAEKQNNDAYDRAMHGL